MNEVINITPTAPNLSTTNVGDAGTIKLNNLPPLDTGGNNAPKKSVNFGPGIEMLMNDKRRVLKDYQKGRVAQRCILS